MLSDFKKNQKRSRYSPGFKALAVALVLLFFAMLLIADFRVYKKGRELSLRVENLKKQIEETKKRNVQLEENIARSDDSNYIEKVAREELDLQKPGEKVVSFIMPSPSPTPEPAKKIFFQSWWNWLKSKF